MPVKKTRGPIGEAGFMLVQVVAMSAVLLLMIYAAFKSVRTTMQLTNTTASSASFQDLKMSIEQNLASTETCALRLFNGGAPSGATLMNFLTNAAAVYPTTIGGPAFSIFAQVETSTTPPAYPEFRIRELQLQRFGRLGRNNAELNAAPAKGTQPFERFVGELAVTADRRGEFLAGVTMRATVPVLLQVQTVPGPATIVSCTTRVLYFVTLGPPTLPGGIFRKSGLECFDRGGTPVIEAGNDYYTCAIPKSSLINRERIRNLAWQADVFPEGWFTNSGSGDRVIYAY